MTWLAILVGPLVAAIIYGAVRCREIYVNRLDCEPWPLESDGLDIEPWVNEGRADR
jgi:hypothetical protein